MTRRPHRHPTSLFLTLSFVHGACLGAAPDEAPGRGFDGPGVEVAVAALNLGDVGEVLWDVEVVSAGGRVVWQRPAAANDPS